MNQDLLLIVLTVFVALAAVSQLLQLFALLALKKHAQALQAQVAAFTPRAEALLQSAQQTIEQSRKQIGEVTAKANEVLDSTRYQLGQVESMITDVAARVKSQAERAEMVLDDTLGRVHETVALLHRGVIRPLKEINGVSVGVRAAIQYMLKGGRPTVAQATHDEEMFI